MNPEFKGFKATLEFLKQLEQNNNREWFNENKANYEKQFVETGLAFIESMRDGIEKLSPHYQAIAKKQGGSMMRIYRDARFSKDKSPYKINMGIQFRHEKAKDVHSPGFYLHIQPGNCFVGVGIWRPESKALRAIREFIIDNPKAWIKATQNSEFSQLFTLTGDSLIKPPRGFAADHPLIDDLKRKDFIAMANLTQKQVSSPNFTTECLKYFQQGSLLMAYLCTALELDY